MFSVHATCIASASPPTNHTPTTPPLPIAALRTCARIMLTFVASYNQVRQNLRRFTGSPLPAILHTRLGPHCGNLSSFNRVHTPLHTSTASRQAHRRAKPLVQYCRAFFRLGSHPTGLSPGALRNPSSPHERRVCPICQRIHPLVT